MARTKQTNEWGEPKRQMNGENQTDKRMGRTKETNEWREPNRQMNGENQTDK